MVAIQLVTVALLAVFVPSSARVGTASHLSPQASLRSSALVEKPLAASGLLAVDSAQRPGTTVVTSKGYFERLSDAFVTSFFGVVLLIFSVPVLWINERRNARMESTIWQGRRECRGVTSAEEDNCGRLVHICADARPAKAVVDPAFVGLSLEGTCLRLRTLVEIYQWKERSETRKEERLGGTQTTTTVYSYHQEWSSSWTDSSNFKEHFGHENVKPSGLEPRDGTVNCSRVEYGEGFLLPDELVSQLCAFQPAGKALPTELSTAVGGHLLRQTGSGDWYYLRYRSPGAAPDEVMMSPEVGDVRVRFEVVPPGPATVLALQAPSQQDKAILTFLPYRAISRGICGLSDEETKRRLLVQGGRDAADLASDDACSSGPLACLCCACNCVNWCMSTALRPEIYRCFQGSLEQEACFNVVQSSNTFTTWVIRLVGWLMMFGGLYAFFSPIITLLTVIPFIAHFGAAAIWVLCLFVTLTVAALIIFLSYLVYHPLLAFGALFVTLLAAAAPHLMHLALAAR